MALLFELMTSVVGLALKPLLLAKLSCQFGARGIFIVVQTWLEVLRFALFLHLIILWRLAIWAIAVLSLPVRAFTALHRERLVEMQLYRLKNELENVLWDRTELEEKLHVAIKERKMMEKMLMELEEEHDEAIVKIELLEGEVQELKGEIQRLKEVQGKALSSSMGYAIVGDDRDLIMDSYNIGKSSSKLDYNKNTKQLSKDSYKDKMHDAIKSGLKIYTYMISNEGDILAAQRDVSLSRSLFSAILSLFVGLVVWEAKDACMPLMVALFTVVMMSLMSVVRLFKRIEHKPALDAVVLLSFNWFVLGTLTYPMLPRIAGVLAPLVLSFLGRVFRWLGL